MRLIDADAIELKYEFGMVNDEGIVCIPMRDVKKSIDNTPTINADYFDAADRIKPCPNCRHQVMKDAFAESPWISVKDRLPKLDTEVIVATKSKVFSALRKKLERYQYWTNAVWDFKPMEKYTGKVLYWMPLPKPPKV